ncbi:MAG: DUF2167 domain-containing protein [Pseudomonadota bacterium]
MTTKTATTTMWRHVCGVAAILAVFCAPGAYAQEAEIDEEALAAEIQAQQDAFYAEMGAIWDGLDKQQGTVALGDDLATLSVPDDYIFLNSNGARTVLVDIWGNPPGGAPVLGMLFPKRYSALDSDSWAVTIEYVDEGYISDEDAAEIDYDKMLRSMKSDTRDESKRRVEAGYEAIELLGWAEQPRYDASTHKLYWAKEYSFGDSEESTLNYDIRALGRKGYLSMTFIAAGSQLAEINASRETVLGMVAFNEGSRYTDFDPQYDKVAAYGIGALVAGKVAAKAGLIGGLLLFLKKFGVIAVLALGALGRWAMGLFGRGKKEA